MEYNHLGMKWEIREPIGYLGHDIYCGDYFVLTHKNKELVEQLVFEHNAFIVLGFETMYKMLKIDLPVDTREASTALKAFLEKLAKEQL